MTSVQNRNTATKIDETPALNVPYLAVLGMLRYDGSSHADTSGNRVGAALQQIFGNCFCNWFYRRLNIHGGYPY